MRPALLQPDTRCGRRGRLVAVRKGDERAVAPRVPAPTPPPSRPAPRQRFAAHLPLRQFAERAVVTLPALAAETSPHCPGRHSRQTTRRMPLHDPAREDHQFDIVFDPWADAGAPVA